VASHSCYSSAAYLASITAFAFALASASIAAFEGQLSFVFSSSLLVIEEVLVEAFLTKRLDNS